MSQVWIAASSAQVTAASPGVMAGKGGSGVDDVVSTGKGMIRSFQDRWAKKSRMAAGVGGVGAVTAWIGQRADQVEVFDD